MFTTTLLWQNSRNGVAPIKHIADQSTQIRPWRGVTAFPGGFDDYEDRIVSDNATGKNISESLANVYSNQLNDTLPTENLTNGTGNHSLLA